VPAFFFGAAATTSPAPTIVPPLTDSAIGSLFAVA
jgi:hypothetical protein